MALYAASSSSSASSSKKYDVFVSFRGEDTRRNFTSHLHDTLCRKKIQTFIDYRLSKGDEISSALVQAIEDSYVAVVVFSKNYASSRWCLDELTHILLCKRDQGQLVIPVFYEVDPTHVRHQTGTYEQAFNKHERDMKHQLKVPRWKAALNEAASLAGWNSLTFGNDSELIQKIVEDILRRLKHRYSLITELKGLVGIDNNCAHIELLLREVETVGIWGMGGIGKTAIAKAIFSKYSSQYEGCCFLENVRENSGKNGSGLRDLQCKLFSKLLEEENLHSGTSIEGSNFAKCRISRMKVFIVLDDISTLNQLEYLALDGEHHFFGAGSKIIITTRDKHVLSKGVDGIYEVKKLEFQESLHLLNLNAFDRGLPITGYERLLERAVVYANGIPLALKVLGSFLRGKSENEWDGTLSKLEKIPHEEIQSVLRLSYDGLNHEEREMFLDIACFLKGNHIEHVTSLLDSYGFFASIGVRALQDKALITVNYDKFVWMHDLIEEMAHEIVRNESIKEPGQRSRLWDVEEVYDVLSSKGSNKVEGIILEVSQIKDIHMSTNTFKKMPSLRFLKLYSTFHVGSSHVHLPEGLEFLPNKLGYLEWCGYPLKSLPSSFCPKKLVELHMPNSKIQKLWDGVQDLVNLKTIDISESTMLTELPDLSKALTLEKVMLEGCESLLNVHSSILSLHSLVVLILRGCKKLKTLKSETHLRSLRYLDVEHCHNLKEFSLSSEKIRELNLFQTGVEILHSSIGCSSNLVCLYLSASRLKNLPHELSCLRLLTMLNLSNCQVINDSKLQILFNGLSSLRRLYLDYCMNITELPNNIQHLLGLEILSLGYCKRLCSLPKLPRSIIILKAKGCEFLETVMASRPLSEGKKEISFENCVKLNDQSLHNIIEDAYSAIIGAVYDDHRPYYSLFCLPGSQVPDWFRYRTTQNTITIDLPPTSQLLGYALCVVQCASVQLMNAQLNCECYLGDFVVQNPMMNWYLREINLDHVYMWYNKFYSCDALKEIKTRQENDQVVTNLQLSFKCSVYDENLKPCMIGNVIKEFGVLPIIVSEYEELVQKRELKKYKRPRDADEEEEPFPQSKKLKLDFGTHTNTCQYIDEMEALLKTLRINIT